MCYYWFVCFPQIGGETGYSTAECYQRLSMMQEVSLCNISEQSERTATTSIIKFCEKHSILSANSSELRTNWND